jgi:hypothetical protein
MAIEATERPAYQRRVLGELSEVAERLESLRRFAGSPAFGALDAAEQERLSRQEGRIQYRDILGDRRIPRMKSMGNCGDHRHKLYDPDRTGRRTAASARPRRLTDEEKEAVKPRPMGFVGRARATMGIENVVTHNRADYFERSGITYPVERDLPTQAAHPMDNEASMAKHRRLMEWFEQERERQLENRREMALDHDFYDGLQWSWEDAQVLIERGQARSSTTCASRPSTGSSAASAGCASTGACCRARKARCRPPASRPRC